MTRKFCYLSTSKLPSTEANSVHVMKMCEALGVAMRGRVEVELLAADSKQHETENLFDYYGVRNTFSIKRFGGSIFWVPRRLARFVIDIMFVFHVLSLKPSVCYARNTNSALILAIFGVRVYVEAHRPFVDGLKGSLLNWLIKKQRIPRLIVISDSLKKIYVESGFPGESISVLHDASVDILELSKNSKITTERQEQIVTNKGKFSTNVGYLGHLYSGRGIEVLEKMAQSYPDVGFHIVGGTKSDVRDWSDRLKDLNNIFLYGFVQPSEIPVAMMCFDVLVAPYQRAVAVAGGNGNTAAFMSPLKIFEYMSSARPILASDLPAIKEVLEHEVSAILCCPDDHESWGAALHRLLADDDLANQIAKQARANYESKYSWAHRAGVVDNLVH